MSDRSRRRLSKWDLKEGPPLSPKNIRKHGRELDKLTPWDGDGGYSTRMSPGLNDWRRQNHGHSPREKWERPVRNRSRSQSRSRSPVRGFRQESNYDRNRSRSQALCRDFNAGRCRRGSDCPFVHQGNRNYDDSWEDRNRKGGMSKYSTAHDATEYPSRISDERERERNRGNDNLCKFFVAGNCRSGKYCRYSHGKTSESPERKMDEANKYREDQRSMGAGPVPDAGKFDDGNGRRGALDRRVNDQLSDGRRDSCFENESQTWNASTTGDGSVIPPEPRYAEKVLGGEDIPPIWNYGLKTSNHIKDVHRHNTNSSSVPMSPPPIQGQDSTWNGSGQMNLSPSISKEIQFPGIPQNKLSSSSNVLHAEEFGQNQQNLGAVALSDLNPDGIGNMVIPIDPQRGVCSNQPNIGMFQEGKLVEDPSTSQITGIHPNNNTVSGEQLTQLTDISASIAQLLEAGRQLPQLYAALSTEQPPPEGPVDQVKPVISNAYIAPPEQHHRLSDSAEKRKSDSDDGLNRAADGEQGEGSNTGSSNQVDHFESCDRKGSADQEAADGSKKVDELDDARNDDHTEKENVDGVRKDEDGKKNKEAKSVRAFKFALAEFAKELLKPTWKDGLIGKETYKTIVKKVVDKVTGSMQGANIPQSQEKIDQYLSVSKPKLTKLVQAYVEKFQKPNK